jgi:nickel-dependent lactate racemase
MVTGKGYLDRYLSEDEIRELMQPALEQARLDDKRVIIIIPDGTRTAPIPQMFRLFCQYLGKRVAALDFLIALGTHKLMNEDAISRLVGATPEEMAKLYPGVRVFNHRWDLSETFITLGQITSDEVSVITNGVLSDAVDVRLNRRVLDYDQIIVCGPTFPHEVVGFSGGNKYFFPGIGGAEVINFSHWLGALITSYDVIGTKYTPVRRLIDKAASLIDRPKLCFSLVVKRETLAGLFVGTPEEAYDAAADLSSKLHINWIDKPYSRVLSVMPRMYEDIWTASKGMYKLEPAVADGGEIVIFAPHIDEVSYSHGHLLNEIGYHVRDYFVHQWDKFKAYPGGVLAHSTHLRGLGDYDPATGVETARIKVTLATGISEERCRRLNLGYLDPESIDFDDWQGKESEGVLFVPKAGEMLYRVRPQATPATAGAA